MIVFTFTDMMTKAQEKIQNRRIAVSEAYSSLNNKDAVTPLVEKLSNKFKVSHVTIYNDIKVYKIREKAINFKFTENTTPDEWFDLCNEYAKSIGYCTSGNFDDYLDQYDDGDTPYDTIREDLLASQS